FEVFYDKPPFYQIAMKTEQKAAVPVAILDDLYMPSSRLYTFLREHLGQSVLNLHQSDGSIDVILDSHADPFPVTCSGTRCLSRIREHYDGIPELIVHYLLLYNLS